MKRKLLAMVLTVSMLLGVMPVSAFAQEVTLYAGGVALSGSVDNPAYAKTTGGAVTTQGASESDYNIKWDGTTLTLKNAEISSGLHENAAIYYNEGNLAIDLEGTNVVTASSVTVSSGGYETGYGIYGSGNIAISGTGSLDVTGSEMQGSFGGSAQSRGINAGNDLTISSGTVVARGGTVTIQNSMTNASVGLYAVNNVTISGGTVTATGGQAPTQSYGIWVSNKNVTISGGEVTASANSSATGGSRGIWADAGTVIVAPQTSQKISVAAGDAAPGSVIEGSPFDAERNIEALIEDAAYFHSAQTYHLTVVLNGGSGTDVSGDYVAGEEIPIDAGSRSNFGFKSWTTTNGGTFVDDTSASTSFTMPAADTTITANWERTTTHSIEAKAYSNGTITPSGIVHVVHGKNQSFQITPDPGYVVSDVTVDGNSVGAVTSYTFTNVVNSHRIVAYFETYLSVSLVGVNFGSLEEGYNPASVRQTVNVYNYTNADMTLTPPNSEYYNVSAESWNVAAGGHITVTIQPKPGLSVGTYDEMLTFTDGNEASASVDLKFNVRKKETYHLTVVLNGGDGTTVSGDHAIGEEISIDAGAKNGYRFAGWTSSNGGTFADASSASTTFTMPAADTTITANWTEAPSGPTTYQVVIDSDVTGGTVTASPRWAARGDTVFLTATADEGYELSALSVSDRNGEAITLDNEGGGVYSFTMPVGRVTVTATFDKAVITLPFTDVHPGDWFYEPVCFVYSQGLMTGTSDTTFEPNTSLSRAMIVAVLHRLEGSPAVSGSNFSDVASGDWYAEAVNWAASVGVVNGFEDGTFQPNAAITREQLAAILCNYDAKLAQTGAAYKGMDVSTSGDLSAYTDAASVSDWAKDSMQWAVGEHLISGVTDDTLAPQAHATRAQVAAILQRYLSE